MAQVLVFPDDFQITDRMRWLATVIAKVQPHKSEITFSRWTNKEGLCEESDVLNLIKDAFDIERRPSALESRGIKTNIKDHGDRGVDVDFKPDSAEVSCASISSWGFAAETIHHPRRVARYHSLGEAATIFDPPISKASTVNTNMSTASVFDSMVFSTEDVSPSEHLSSERRCPNETDHDERRQAKATVSSKRSFRQGNSSRQKTFIERSDFDGRNTSQQRSSFRQDRAAKAIDVVERTTQQQASSTEHRSPGATPP